jgi:hemerythrin
MSIEWKDTYKFGGSEIDLQLEQLFGLVNDFLAATDKASLSPNFHYV